MENAVRSLLILAISYSTISLLPTQPSPAQTPLVPQPSTAPLELGRLQPPSQAVDDGSDITAYTINCDKISTITANTICQQQLTIPSLWWATEQFGDKLLDNWLAYPATGTTPARIDLVVNRENWTLLDYLERYEFLNHFGTVARDYGYNVRLFNYQEELLATYTCNFNTTPPMCNIQLEVTGNTRVGGQAQQAQ
jgi:hypothetical protein